jgi:hypothetical protein
MHVALKPPSPTEGAPEADKPLSPITPGFKAKPTVDSMCAHESSFHTYRTENGYRITNVTIYNIYYTNNVLQKIKFMRNEVVCSLV